MTAYNNYGSPASETLDELLHSFEDGTQITVTEAVDSPWIGVDVFGRYGWHRFAIWKSTDALYAVSKDGAAGDDPITVSEAVAKVQDT